MAIVMLDAMELEGGGTPSATQDQIGGNAELLSRGSTMSIVVSVKLIGVSSLESEGGLDYICSSECRTKHFTISRDDYDAFIRAKHKFIRTIRGSI